MTARKRTNLRKGRADRQKAAYLEKLIEEAVVGCDDESEHLRGFFTALDDNLALPFATIARGDEVVMEKIDMNAASEIGAVCQRGRERQRMPLLDLPLPGPGPKGAEWIEAFRGWTGGR
jgi:hypothetical protein